MSTNRSSKLLVVIIACLLSTNIFFFKKEMTKKHYTRDNMSSEHPDLTLKVATTARSNHLQNKESPTPSRVTPAPHVKANHFQNRPSLEEPRQPPKWKSRINAVSDLMGGGGSVELSGRRCFREVVTSADCWGSTSELRQRSAIRSCGWGETTASRY